MPTHSRLRNGLKRGLAFAKLRRITSGASWIPQIDGLRFVAIVAVVLFHACGEATIRGPHPLALGPIGNWIVAALRYGDRGVALFFIISGFILARPFVRQHRLGGKPVKLGAYYLRRVTRLEPPYLISLLVYVAAQCWILHAHFRALLPHLLASMAYAHQFIYGRVSSINFVTWSLEIEIQFYILAPLMGLLFIIQSTVLRRSVLTILTVFASILSVSVDAGSHFLLPYCLQFFLAGFLLADLLEIRDHEIHPLWRWDLVSLIGWFLIFYLPKNHVTLACFPFIVIPVYFAAFHGKGSNWFFRQPFVALTGGMCYSIYLMHMLIISTAFRAVKHVSFHSGDATLAIQITLLFAAALAVSTVYFVLIERPCMDPKWPQKLWHKWRALGTPSPRSSAAAVDA